MDNFKSSEVSINIISQKEKGNLSPNEVKSLFYYLTAKPDTEVRLLAGGKTLYLADIISIHEQVMAKLKNHEISANVTSINFILSNKKIKDYFDWEEFNRENWDTINDTIQSISINWDVLIRLPQYELPQRHSMKLRIGTAITPKDLFQLVLTSDNISELMEVGSSGICKVDFINNTIAIELLNIVTNWYEGLQDSQRLNSIQKFLKKQGSSFSEIIRYMMPSICLIIAYFYSSYINAFLKIGESTSIDGLEKIVIVFTAVVSLGLWFGKELELFIDRRVAMFKEYPIFLITRGDQNAIKRVENDNDRLAREIVSKIGWTFFTVLISFLLKYVMNYVINNL